MRPGRIFLFIIIALCSACTSKIEKQKERERGLLDRLYFSSPEDRPIKDWLVLADENKKMLEEANKQKDLYTFNGSINCNQDLSSNCRPVSKILSPPDSLNRYTPEFRRYVHDYYKNLSAEYYQLTKEITSLVKKRNKAEAEANKIREERELAEINEDHQMLLTRIKTEKEALSKLAKNAGYAGFTNAPIQEVLVQVRKNGGGLENFFNYVIGCVPVIEDMCETQDSRFKLLQNLQNGSLYHYGGYRNHDSFTIFVENEKSKMYQEGQRLKTGHYVFKGMLSYTSAFGPRSVPHFAPAVY